MAREQSVVGPPTGRDAVGARRAPAAVGQLRSEVRALRQELVDCREAQQALREAEDLHRVNLETFWPPNGWRRSNASLIFARIGEAHRIAAAWLAAIVALHFVAARRLHWRTPGVEAR